MAFGAGQAGCAAAAVAVKSRRKRLQEQARMDGDYSHLPTQKQLPQR
jgi:hypothetical protein